MSDPNRQDRSEPDLSGAAAQPMLLDAEEFGAVFEHWYAAVREALLSEKYGPPSRGPDGGWALVGIKRRGALLASRLRERLAAEGISPLYGEVDISLYRDDYHLQAGGPRVLGTEVPFGVDGVKILLVDDVLYTGRTVRAAIDLLLDFGRPRVIELVVFIDRGHRELPIQAGIVGRSIATGHGDRVKVKLVEMDGSDGVCLVEGDA